MSRHSAERKENTYLNAGLVQVTQIAGGLASFAHHETLWLDNAEGVNDHLSLDGLNRVHNDGHRTSGERFETLSRVTERDFPAMELPAVYLHPRWTTNIRNRDASDTNRLPCPGYGTGAAAL